jgi:hypothetical protein
MGLFDFLGELVKPISDTIIGLDTNAIKKQELQNAISALEISVSEKMLDYEKQLMISQADIIKSEAQGQSWLQRNWRPLLMCMFGFIVANNYILVPYLQAMFGWSVQLQIPPDLWDLLKLGIGGYVVGRSVEKTAASVTEVIKSKK